MTCRNVRIHEESRRGIRLDNMYHKIDLSVNKVTPIIFEKEDVMFPDMDEASEALEDYLKETGIMPFTELVRILKNQGFAFDSLNLGSNDSFATFIRDGREREYGEVNVIQVTIDYFNLRMNTINY